MRIATTTVKIAQTHQPMPTKFGLKGAKIQWRGSALVASGFGWEFVSTFKAG